MVKKKLLEDLNQRVDACPFCKAEGNKLQHILGGGEVDCPRYLFVLINPTYRNITSDPNHRGIRIPFMGGSNFWRVLVESGFLPKKIYGTTEKGTWDQNDIWAVATALKEASLYLTNLVKCCSKDAAPPNVAVIKYHTQILKEEIQITDPKLVITFGLLPFQALVGRSIKLSAHLKSARAGDINFYKTVPISEVIYKVFPTFFPVGRGKPKESLELLKYLRK